jgi:phosphoserine phosphatase
METNNELILIRISGVDRPGLTASITEILAQSDATILDIGQADIHSTSRWVFCVSVTSSTRAR